MGRISRRGVLSIAGATALGGCLSGSETDCSLAEPVAVDSTWPSPRRDSANTAGAPGEATPDPTDLSRDWETSPSQSIGNVAIGDRRVCYTEHPFPGGGADPARLTARDLQTGEREWGRTIMEWDRPPGPQVSAPFIRAGAVVVSAHRPGQSTSSIVAVDIETGETNWQTQRSQHHELIACTGGVVLTRSGGSLHAFTQDGGDHCWKYELSAAEGPGAVTRIVGYPARVNDDFVTFVAGADGSYGVVSLTGGSGDHRWYRNLGVADHPPWFPLVQDGIVFVPNREGLEGLNPADGSTSWGPATPNADPAPLSEMAAGGDRIVARGTILQGFSRGSESRRWKRRGTAPHPTIGGLYVFGVDSPEAQVGADATDLVVLDRQTGDLVGRKSMSVPLHGPVTIGKQRLLLQYVDGGGPVASHSIGLLALS